MNTLRKPCLLALLSLLALTASAEILSTNPLTIEPLAVTPGEVTDLELYYDSTVDYIALDFQLTLPEGVSFVMDPDDEAEPDYAQVNPALSRTHTVTAHIGTDGIYRAVCISLRNAVLKSPGWLIRIPIKVSDDFKGSVRGTLGRCSYATPVHNEDNYEEPSYFDIYVAPTAIQLSDSEIYLTPGTAKTLTAHYQPSTAAERPLVWTSSDSEITTVDETGKVTGVSQGVATITAAVADDMSVKATCSVTVGTYTSIDTVIAENTTTLDLDGRKADVYDIHGIRVLTGATSADLRTLAPGLYIITTATHTLKVHK